MLLSSNILESGTFWSIAIGFAAAIAGAAVGAYLTVKLAKPKRRTLEYQWRKNYEIPGGAYGLQSPRIVDIVLHNPGDQSITADSFHLGQPIEIELDGHIDSIAGLKTYPSTTVPPVIMTTGGKIQIQPFLLVANQQVEFSAIIDGPGQVDKFKFVAPLTDIEPALLPDEKQLLLDFQAANLAYSQEIRKNRTGAILLMLVAIGFILATVHYSDGLATKTYTPSDVCKGKIRVTEAVHKDLCGK